MKVCPGDGWVYHGDIPNSFYGEGCLTPSGCGSRIKRLTTRNSGGRVGEQVHGNTSLIGRVEMYRQDVNLKEK